jgi:hypothetical protein
MYQGLVSASKNVNSSTSSSTSSPIINNTINVSQNSDSTDSTGSTETKKVPLISVMKREKEPRATLLQTKVSSATELTDYPAISSDPSASSEKTETSLDERKTEFEKTLLQILIKKFTNEKQLMQNILDINKNIILSASELCELIKMMVGVEPLFAFEEEGKSCFAKIGIYQLVKSIKVNGYDFSVAYNYEYNFFSQYRVSLDKVSDL